VPDEVIAGRYRLLEPLGRGAMSAVWLAEDEELQRQVALKMLAPTADRARFEREARAAAALSHPNLCGLFDYGEADGRPFMVLEYLPNGSLEDRLKEGPLPDAETLRIATEIAMGLAHAHARGLVHRDLKPANVLFDAEERAKIADFGIARMGDAGTLTEAGTVLGTASYISPEQAAGRPAGPESDVYSFGVILFRMLTGSLPFVSTNAMELVRRHRDEPPPAVQDLRPDAPPRLAAIVAAALQKDPRDRPPDGAALLAELRGEDATAATMVPPPPAEATQATQVLRPPPRGPQRRRLLPLAVLALVLAAAGVAAALIATRGSGSGSSDSTLSTPSLTLPTVATAGRSTLSTAPTTTAATAPTTTAPTTTHHETTTAPTTTHAQSTTAATTTAPLPPTTTEPLPTTTAPLPTTTVDTSTDATATTTVGVTVPAP
jgi:serine/threonine-protein kinase